MLNVNIALRGGASSGLVYFRLIKELHNKKIFPLHLTGSSAGGIFAACIACIRNPEIIYKLFLKIKGDKILRLSCEAEFEKNIFKGIISKILAFIPIFSMKIMFKKYLTWQRAAANNVRYLAIGVIKENDLIKTVGYEFFETIKKVGLDNAIKNKDFKISSYEIIEKLPMYFFTNMGTFKYNGKGFEKISNKKVPLWKAVLATFANPLLPPVYLPFENGKKYKCFDGGAANNYGNVAFLKTCKNNFYQISCGGIPGELDGHEKGIQGIDKIYYNLNRAKNEVRIKSKNKYNGFFAFYDANIEAYYRESATDIF